MSASPLLPTINGERILLRQLRQSDVEAIYNIFSDPQVTRYWSTPPLSNIDAASQLLDDIEENNLRGSILKWGIALKSNDLVIGTATLFNLSLENGRAEVGYAQARAYWRQGYMTEALLTLIAYSFEVLKLRRLEADVDPRNEASIRSLERMGFKREGFLRERWHVAGEIQDAYFYGLLRHEWPPKTQAS